MNHEKYFDKKTALVVSRSQIQYIFVTPHTAYKHDDFFDTTFEILRKCPKDLLQLRDSGDYFTFCYQLGIRKSINLYNLPDIIFNGSASENLSIFMQYSGMFNNDLVKVFFIDEQSCCHEDLGGMLRLLPFSYIHITGEPKEEIGQYYDLSKAFNSGLQLINLIKKDLPVINDEIKKVYELEITEFDFESNKDALKWNPYYATLYCKNNYFTLNQILANYWLKEPQEPAREESLESFPYRVAWQIKQIGMIDTLHMAIKEKKPVIPIEPLLPAMIIAAPFHFPRRAKLKGAEFKNKKEKSWFRASQSEQELNYKFSIEEDLVKYLGKEQVAAIMGIVTKRLLNLDTLTYLHAQFGYGPTYRLPIIGKSLNMDLSHFQQFFSNKQNAIKKILTVGELMCKHLIADDFKQMLAKRNGQLVFISDLPMEWLKIGKYPLCLTHDICRLPEFNFSSLVNNFVHNQRLNFRIQPDILTRTLVVHCASDDEPAMNKLFDLIDGFNVSLNFSSVRCSTVEEISAAIKKHLPDLLIFDCHGNFDEKTLSSYLVVDGKNKVLLTGEDIIKHQISAPLVFISACSTMPNYGYVKFLSDAFFQAGAFSVTATFLPIKMRDAAVLMIRLLNNLKQMEKKVIHCNWLAFISHTLRGVLIYETIRKEQAKNHLPQEIDQRKVAEILMELMVFEKREEAFDNLKAYLKTISPAIDTLFENLEHEWLSYTTIGRADLIFFENWHQKHQLENFGQSF